ncbi:MAG TPA: hypothetical protein VFD02_03950 [Syntrophomonadaceae bacterium]|nr:hypothetical protein [Syntrophomonadaceae bacterium]
MEIRGVVNNIPPAYMNKQEVDQPKGDDKGRIDGKDEFIRSDEAAKKATYDKPKVDHATIGRLKAESDRAYNSLKQIVAQLLERQGLTFREWNLVEVDETARLEAQALIGEGGELSPEKVSDRIVDFAKALSGGDKDKIETLRGAIEKGFEAAAKALGGKLPEISQQTYDLVMEKLDNWLQE